MIEILVLIILLLFPSIFSLLLYYGLKQIASPEMKKAALLLIFVVFSVSIVLWVLFSPHIVGPPSALTTLMAVIIIAFSSAYPVALAMNVFSGIFSEKGEKLAAALCPLISVPFIIKLLISPDVWAGKSYGDMFFIQIPLIGWIIDPFTCDWKHTAGDASLFPGIILYFGFFIQMIIVMLLVFLYFKVTVTGSAGTNDKKDD